MKKVDNQGWISVNKYLMNLALIEHIHLNTKNIYIYFCSGNFEKFEYDNEDIAKFEFELVKKEMGFQ